MQFTVIFHSKTGNAVFHLKNTDGGNSKKLVLLKMAVDLFVLVFGKDKVTTSYGSR